MSERACRVCGCTDCDCSGCIERTGKPCHWIGEDLCSACEGFDPDDEFGGAFNRLMIGPAVQAETAGLVNATCRQCKLPVLVLNSETSHVCFDLVSDGGSEAYLEAHCCPANSSPFLGFPPGTVTLNHQLFPVHDLRR